MSAVRRGTAAHEVQYLVLPDPSKPLLLARVRWPDVFQAISAAEPDWRSDPGLFDLPYDPSSRVVTYEQAAAIAAEWGASVPAHDEGAVSGPILIRRMPANWSELSPAVKRAWWIEPRRAGESAPESAPAGASRWRRRRRRSTEVDAADPGVVIVLSDVHAGEVIDLTGAQHVDTLATVEDA